MPNSFKKLQQSFTLIELIAVVLMISLFATVGFSQYQRVITRTRQRDVITNLYLIKATQQICFAKYGEFRDIADLEEFHVKIAEPPNITYSCEIPNFNTYTCTATYTGFGENWACTVTQDANPSCS